jgi:septal ring factor EnvC (AmiA/AmiB activator)
MNVTHLKLVHSQPHSIEVPISPGELLDRLTILELDSDQTKDGDQRMKIFSDWSKLAPLAADLLAHDSEITRLKGELRTVNETLKEIDSEMRDHERRGDFGTRFVALARSVYHTHDQRLALQHAIDLRSASTNVD